MLKRLLLGIILNGIGLYIVTYLLPEVRYTGGIIFFILGGCVMGFLNWLIKPILKIVTFPLQILTLGISLILLNGVIFWLFDQGVATLAIDGIHLIVPDIKTYFIAGFVFGIINWLIHLIIPNK